MMKKALTLAMVLALGVTASAYAANAAEPIKISANIAFIRMFESKSLSSI